MRPLTLTIEGLRSFRSPVEISFLGRDHLAVIGDTWAGKSSILEAMTYALFGRTTFTGHANQEIINDLADHMRVTLRFTVAGRTFEVTRTLRRAGDCTVGAAKASLTEFGAYGAEIHKIEQVRQVNDRIKEVLGLDADAFLRTVLLPQGQYAQLLVGDDPAARAAILRQVWRTDELTRAGQLADEALPELSRLVGHVTQTLDGTPDDPETHLQQRRAGAEQRTEAARRARDTHHTATTARDTLAEADKTTRAAAKVLEKVRGFDFDTAIAAAEEIVRSASAVATDRKAADEQQNTLRQELQAVPSDNDGSITRRSVPPEPSSTACRPEPKPQRTPPPGHARKQRKPIPPNDVSASYKKNSKTSASNWTSGRTRGKTSMQASPMPRLDSPTPRPCSTMLSKQSQRLKGSTHRHATRLTTPNASGRR